MEQAALGKGAFPAPVVSCRTACSTPCIYTHTSSLGSHSMSEGAYRNKSPSDVDEWDDLNDPCASSFSSRFITCFCAGWMPWPCGNEFRVGWSNLRLLAAHSIAAASLDSICQGILPQAPFRLSLSFECSQSIRNRALSSVPYHQCHTVNRG